MLLGKALKEWSELERNPYDRIGHLFQGFVPSLAAGEILLRGGRVRGRGMFAFLVASAVLAFSATCEPVEWGVAVAFADGAVAFLGTQGDPLDAQRDMFCALLGALTALGGRSRLHDRKLQRLVPRPAAAAGAGDGVAA